MNARGTRIDLIKLTQYVLRRIWLVVLCAELGFAAMYIRTTRFMTDTYTASGTMYVNNANPNLANYQYANSSDLDSAVQLINTYLIVVKSDQVMRVVAEKLNNSYPGIAGPSIASTLSMASVAETGVAAVKSTTANPRMSADIVNAVLEVAPDEIIRVVGAGNIEIVDYAKVPIFPDNRGSIRKGFAGGLAGVVLGCGVLLFLFLMNRRVLSVRDLTENYTPPVLASIQRVNGEEQEENAEKYVLTNQSSMEIIENYAKLRMNLLYTLIGKNSKTVVITSSISGEGKSTIAANLAISCAMGGKKVLLVDSDLRRACQINIFKFDKHAKGLSDVLVNACEWNEAVIHNVREALDLMPAGHIPPNPAELLESHEMLSLLSELEQSYDLVLLDMPPINVVADPLVLSNNTAGCLFVVRQNFSDHRDIHDALISAEMTGMNVLGFIFYGEDIHQGGYYRSHYYRNYYNQYDYRKRSGAGKEGQQT